MTLDVSHVLHECRTANLRRIDASDKVLVSIGAANLWYFDWVRDCCGEPSEHVGVEFYMPKPEGLPDRVQWVANTAGHMPDVKSTSADIMVSGQNIEHLWQEEVVGFLVEAHRVLKPGGLLVIDSPNRSVTQAYGSAHPEHMVELTVEEATDLLTIAGFDVEAVRGVFLCRDPRTGELLPLAGLSDAPPRSIIDRCVSAGEAPRDSYVWWIHARRAERQPDRAALAVRVEAVWRTGWPERMNRLVTNIGRRRMDQGKAFYECDVGQAGALLYGPYAPVRAGRHRATLNVRLLSEAPPDAVIGVADVVVREVEVKAQVELRAGDLSTTHFTEIPLEFDLERTAFGFQMRLFSSGAAALSVEKDIGMETLA